MVMAYKQVLKWKDSDRGKKKKKKNIELERENPLKSAWRVSNVRVRCSCVPSVRLRRFEGNCTV